MSILLRETGGLEPNKEVKRRTNVVAIFPSEKLILRLIGAVLFDQNDDWQSQQRYMMVEVFSQIDTTRISKGLADAATRDLILT